MLAVLEHIEADRSLIKPLRREDLTYLQQIIATQSTVRRPRAKRLFRELCDLLWAGGMLQSAPAPQRPPRVMTGVPRLTSELHAAFSLRRVNAQLTGVSMQKLRSLSVPALLALLDVVLPFAVPASPELTRAWMARCRIDDYKRPWLTAPASPASVYGQTQVILPKYVDRLLRILISHQAENNRELPLFQPGVPRYDLRQLHVRDQIQAWKDFRQEHEPTEKDHGAICALLGSNWRELWKKTRVARSLHRVTEAALALDGMPGSTIRLCLAPVQPIVLPHPILPWTCQEVVEPPRVTPCAPVAAEPPNVEDPIGVWRSLSAPVHGTRTSEAEAATRTLMLMQKARKSLARLQSIYGNQVPSDILFRWQKEWWEQLGGPKSPLAAGPVLLHWLAKRAANGESHQRMQSDISLILSAVLHPERPIDFRDWDADDALNVVSMIECDFSRSDKCRAHAVSAWIRFAAWIKAKSYRQILGNIRFIEVNGDIDFARTLTVPAETEVKEALRAFQQFDRNDISRESAEEAIALWIMCRMGLRIHELIYLRQCDFQLLDMSPYARVRRSKTAAGIRSPRPHPDIPKSELSMVFEFWKELVKDSHEGDQGPLFRSLLTGYPDPRAAAEKVRAWVRRLFPGASPHDLRRFYVSMLVMKSGCYWEGEELTAILHDVGHACDDTLPANYLVCGAHLRANIFRFRKSAGSVEKARGYGA